MLRALHVTFGAEAFLTEDAAELLGRSKLSALSYLRMMRDAKSAHHVERGVWQLNPKSPYLCEQKHVTAPEEPEPERRVLKMHDYVVAAEEKKRARDRAIADLSCHIAEPSEARRRAGR
jgi:hypothetical protein